MNAMMQTHMHGAGSSLLSGKIAVLALVASAHLAMLYYWAQHPDRNAVAVHELAVTLATADAPQPAPPRPRSVVPAPRPQQVEARPQPVAAEQAPSQPVAAALPVVASAPAVVPDVEPDYKASYLNNVPPSYPLAARRMGLQGRVVLNVEVLADGVSGQITIQKSSGHAMLDNAALQAVKTWRFVPARQAGHSVDKWFMIPVQFSLKDQAA